MFTWVALLLLGLLVAAHPLSAPAVEDDEVVYSTTE
jgi:hypothetical protein